MFKNKHVSLKILPVVIVLFLPVAFVQAVAILNPLGADTTIISLITAILNSLMIIGAPISVLLIVFVGFKFVMAQGDMAAIKTARQNFLYTIIGIVIFFGATLIMNVLTSTISQITGGSGI